MARFGGINPLGITTLRFGTSLDNIPKEVRLEEFFPPEEVEEWGIQKFIDPDRIDGFTVNTLWRPGALARCAEEDVAMDSGFIDELTLDGEPIDFPDDDEEEDWDDILRILEAG